MQQQFPDNNGVVKDELSLREVILSIQKWWKYILSKWKVVMLFAVIGSALGFTFALISPISYKAEAVFVLDNKKGNSDFSSLAAKFGLGSPGSSQGLFNSDNNIIVFLKSRRMGAQTLLSYVNSDTTNGLLIDQYLVAYGIRKKWKDKRLQNIKFKPHGQNNSRLADSIITQIHNRIVKNNLSIIKPEAEADVISVTTTSVNEEFSKSYTENLIENATTFYTRSVTRKVQYNVDVLQHQVDSVRQLLNSAISGVAVTNDAIPNLNPALQRLKVPSQKRIIDVELNKAILEQLVVNLEMAKVNLRQETPFIQIVDSPVLPLERSKVGKLKGILGGGIIVALAFMIYLSLRYLIKLLLQD
jgi:hypothetical protein